MNQKIYNIQIQMTCQADADRMKQICLDYSLKYWDDEIAFQYWGELDKFLYTETDGFGVYTTRWSDNEPITIEQFLEILNEK